MYRHLLLSMSFGVFLFSACTGKQSSSSTSKNTDVSLKQEVLTKFDTLVLSTLENYYVAYQGLQEKVKDWQASPTDLMFQQKAQEAWTSAMGFGSKLKWFKCQLCVSAINVKKGQISGIKFMLGH